MPENLIWLRWHLDPDGGGEAQVALDEKTHVEDRKYVFDSLDRRDQLPLWVAEAIRKDGRESGELPRRPN